MTEMNLMPLGEQEYNELLRQAVAVIDQVQKFRGHLVDNYEMSKILNNYIAISY